MNLELLKQQIEVLRADLNHQGNLMQKDMNRLVAGMTTVVQALDRRIAVIEECLKSHELLTDRSVTPPTETGGTPSGKEL